MEDEFGFVEASGVPSSWRSTVAVRVLCTLVGLLTLVFILQWFSDGAGRNQVGFDFQQFTGTNSSHSRHALALQQSQTSGPQGAQADSNCTRICGSLSIPYPFGFSPECAWSPYFQLDCLDNSPEDTGLYALQPGPWPYLTNLSGSYTDDNFLEHNVTSFQILNVTSGKLMINITAIKAMDCTFPNFNGNASIRLPAGGPYRTSTENVFYVSGCSSEGQYASVPVDVATISEGGTCGPISCVNQFTYAFCNLYDCCTLSMPTMTDIFLSGGGISYANSETCGFASIILPSSYSSPDITRIGIGSYGLELLWVLPVVAQGGQELNCTTLEDRPDYACAPRSDCAFVDYPGNFTGYYCDCTLDGFQGDGYLSGTGCEDIDECASPGLNRCVQAATCINLEGSYNCSCPELMRGDGFQNGSGCTYIDFCKPGEPNDCAPNAVCQSALGVFNCSCPTHLVGDGLANGSGCQGKSNIGVIIGASAGGLTLFAIINGLMLFWYYKKRQKDRRGEGLLTADFSRRHFLQEIQNKEGANICRLFTYDELAKATNHFSADRVLGTGGFGTVFEGTLDDGLKLAIKKAKHDVGGARNDTKQFINEVTILSQVNHRNLVKLLGCCLETQVPVLIYEFISNGTVMDHLRPDPATPADKLPPPLDWSKRLKIALGTAEALTYLHSGTSPPIYHRDVKTANILLDDKYVAKVADFGLSKFVPLGATHLSTAIQGTPGYLDPDYFDNYQITDKSDVYSFGVVLLELVTSEKPVDLCRQAQDHNLALRCGRLMQHGRLEDIIDPVLGASSNPTMLEAIHAVAKVALKCVERHREDRPGMQEVLEELKSIGAPARKLEAEAYRLKMEGLRTRKFVRFDDEEYPLTTGLSTNSAEFSLMTGSDVPSGFSSLTASNSSRASSSPRPASRKVELTPR